MASLSRMFNFLKQNTSGLKRTQSCFRKTFKCQQAMYSFSTVCSSRSTAAIPMSSLKQTSMKEQPNFATVSEDRDFLQVEQKDGELMRYPYVWLRDNCTCNDCYNSEMNQRLFSYRTFNADVKLVDITENASTGVITLHGTDGHTTTLDMSWLQEKGSDLLKGRPDIDIQKVYWGSDAKGIFPVFNYNDVIEDSRTMFEWMKSIKTFGVGLITGAPKISKELDVIANKIGHMRTTFHGDISIIKAKSDAFFLGYTPIELPLHTDYTFGKTVPGVFVLHSIERPESGGENWFADGFKAANELRAKDEDAFKLLCKGVLEFEMDGVCDGRQVHVKDQAPTIRLNETGELEMISFSDHSRTANIKNIETNEIPAFYRALKKYADILYSPENFLAFPLEEGDMLATDNFRILHGRAGFRLKKDRIRHVEHIYIDVEDFDSRMRCIASNLSSMS